MKFQIAAISTFICALAAVPALAQTPTLITEEMMVKTADAGIEVYVRNKRPANMTNFRPEQTVLYVHGATYPSETAFDLKLDGLSWMEYIASRGYDVWLVDLRGYGKSVRPPNHRTPTPRSRSPRRRRLWRSSGRRSSPSRGRRSRSGGGWSTSWST